MESWKKSAFFSFLTFLIALIVILSANAIGLLLPWYSEESELNEEPIKELFGEEFYAEKSEEEEYEISCGPNYCWLRDGNRITGDIILNPSENDSWEMDDDTKDSWERPVAKTFKNAYYLTIAVAAMALVTFIVTILVGKQKVVREVGSIFTYILIFMTLIPPIFTALAIGGGPMQFIYISDTEDLPILDDDGNATGESIVMIEVRGFASLGFYIHFLNGGMAAIAAMTLKNQFTGVKFRKREQDTIFNKDGSIRDRTGAGKKGKNIAYKEFDKPMAFVMISFILALLMVISAFSSILLIPMMTGKWSSSMSGEGSEEEQSVSAYWSQGLSGIWMDQPEIDLATGDIDSPGILDTFRIVDEEKYYAYKDFKKLPPEEEDDFEDNETYLIYVDTENGVTYFEKESRIVLYTSASYLTLGVLIVSLISIILLSINRTGSGNVKATKIVVLIGAILAFTVPIMILAMDPDVDAAEFIFHSESEIDKNEYDDTETENTYTNFASIGWYFLLLAGILNFIGFFALMPLQAAGKQQLLNAQGKKISKEELVKRNVDLKDLIGPVDGGMAGQGASASIPPAVPPQMPGSIPATPAVPQQPGAPGVPPVSPVASIQQQQQPLGGPAPTQQQQQPPGGPAPTQQQQQPPGGPAPTQPIPPAASSATPGLAQATTMKVKCPTCGITINVQNTGGPVEILCPGCGTRGTIG